MTTAVQLFFQSVEKKPGGKDFMYRSVCSDRDVAGPFIGPRTSSAHLTTTSHNILHLSYSWPSYHIVACQHGRSLVALFITNWFLGLAN